MNLFGFIIKENIVENILIGCSISFLLLLICCSYLLFVLSKKNNQLFLENLNFSTLENEKNDLIEKIGLLEKTNEKLGEQTKNDFGIISSYNSKIEKDDELIKELKEQIKVKDETIDKLNEKVKETSSQIAKFESDIENCRKNQVEMEKRISENTDRMKIEFKVLAQNILEEKQASLKNSAENNISKLLQPLDVKIAEFKQKVEQLYKSSDERSVKFETRLDEMIKTQQNLSEQALNLSSALKDQKKVQGCWGEMILEELLDKADLKPYYRREVSTHDQDGKVYRPDVVIDLPQDRQLIIDSKVSINAYVRAQELSGNDYDKAIDELVTAIKTQIDNLAKKDYSNLEGFNSPNLVLMFIPIENAFMAAIKRSPNLINYAQERKIILVSQTTIFATMNLVYQLWKFENHNRNTKELIKIANNLIKKFNNFTKNMEEMSKCIEKLEDSYNSAYKYIFTGKENVVRQLNKFTSISNEKLEYKDNEDQDIDDCLTIE